MPTARYEAALAAMVDNAVRSRPPAAPMGAAPSAHSLLYAALLETLDELRRATDELRAFERRAAPAADGYAVAPAAAGAAACVALVVDDDPSLRRLYAAALTRVGLQVVAVGRAEDAVPALDGRTPALLLTDLTLPGESGEAMAARLAAAHPGMKLVAASGLPPDSRRALAVRALGAQYYQKPFAFGELLQTARRLLASAEQP